MGEKPHLTLDIEQPGMSEGALVVSQGSDYESLSLPVFSINKGEGPTLLIIGGCHGDEVEGPIVARRLLDWLPEAQTCGRTIILPVVNPLAVQACTRNTPVDELDLNRVYPGRADGSITERIAHAVYSLLVPLADTMFDLHSFAIGWDLPPATSILPIADPELMAKTLRLAEAFMLPLTLVWEFPQAEVPGMLDFLVPSLGKIYICPEFGGGTISAEAIQVYETGVRNALIALGIVEGKAEYSTFRQQKSGQTLKTRIASDFLKAPLRGIFAPLCSVLDRVNEGDIVGILYPMDSLSKRDAVGIRASSTSIVYAIRSGSHVDIDEPVAYFGHPLDHQKAED